MVYFWSIFEGGPLLQVVAAIGDIGWLAISIGETGTDMDGPAIVISETG